jgi:hypothetical protein
MSYGETEPIYSALADLRPAMLLLHPFYAQCKSHLRTFPLRPCLKLRAPERWHFSVECNQDPSEQRLTEPICPWKPVSCFTWPRSQRIPLCSNGTAPTFLSVLWNPLAFRSFKHTSICICAMDGPRSAAQPAHSCRWQRGHVRSEIWLT